MVRSKPSQPRIWSQKWKRDSWTQHLSGRILKPSHAKPFETEWTCLWPVIHASHSAQRASGSEPKTLATSGRTSQEQLELFALDSVSSRMSKDTSASDSAKSSESWEQSVTRRRGEYSLRVKSARLTSASGSSSWPTISVNESKNSVGKSQLDRNSIPLGTMVIMHGLPAPANPSTHGSRQELSEENWVTPRTSGTSTRPNKTTPRQGLTLIEQARANEWRTPGASDGEGGVMEMREGCAGKYKLRDHVVAVQKQEWRTPTVAEEKNQNTSKQIYLQNQVGATQKQWATPNAFCFQPPENTEQWTKRAEFQQTEKGVNLHKPIQTQVLHEVEKQWGTPTARDHKSGRGNEEREYKELTPMVERQQSGKLNPRWVETLMGLPVGWTMPSCKSPVTIERTSCASSATESCQQQQSEHSELFGRNSQND